MALEEQRGPLFLYVDVSGTLTQLGGIRSGEMNEESDTIDAGHAGNFGFKKFLPGQNEWDASYEAVFLEDPEGGIDPALEALQDARAARETIPVEIRTPIGSAWAGDVLVTGISRSGDYDDVMTVTVDLKGSGEPVFTVFAPAP